MKSLAHPEWPYTGTPHEWRGFVKTAERPRPLKDVPLSELADALVSMGDQMQVAVYQKQNLGPELK